MASFENLLARNEQSIKERQEFQQIEQANKRAKIAASSYESAEMNFDQALACAIFKIPTSLMNKETLCYPPISNPQSEINEDFIKNLEIEARVGMLVVNKSRRFLPRNKRKKGIVIDGVQRQQSNLKFESGIDESAANHIKAKIDKKEFDITPMKKTVIYAQDAFGGKRVHIDENSLKSGNPNDLRGKVERKEKLFEMNVALTCHDYDMRISASSEISDNQQLEPIDINQYQTERIKKRWTYVHKQFNNWKIDLTEVSTRRLHNSLDAEVSKEIELEFELRPERMKRWLLEKDTATKDRIFREIVVHLVFLLDFFVQCEIHPLLAEIPPELLQEPLGMFTKNQPQYEEIEKRIRRLNILLTTAEMDCKTNAELEDRISPQLKNNRLEFIGSMPVNFFRSNLSNVLENDYYITEKTDGTRYLLYIFNNHRNEQKLYFLDRARCIFTWSESDFLAQTLCTATQSSVLDGEFVFDFTLKQFVFMVFDVLLFNGEKLVRRPFAERIACIHNEIMPRVVNAILVKSAALSAAAASTTESTSTTGSANSNAQNFPRLMDKKFVRKEQFRELLNSIREYVFNDRSGRHHMTDGLIFQPNTPYVFNKYFDLMKWKWSELRSVDLIVEIRDSSHQHQQNLQTAAPTNQDVMLLCTGPDGSRVNCSLRGEKNYGLGKFDCYRMLAERQQLLFERSYRPTLSSATHETHSSLSANSQQVIAEVTYDSSTGYWCYHKLRKDKTEPNYLNSVLGVFMEQAEALTQDELEYIIVASLRGQENDYEAHLRKMRRNLLEWQRNTYK